MKPRRLRTTMTQTMQRSSIKYLTQRAQGKSKLGSHLANKPITSHCVGCLPFQRRQLIRDIGLRGITPNPNSQQRDVNINETWKEWLGNEISHHWFNNDGFDQIIYSKPFKEGLTQHACGKEKVQHFFTCRILNWVLTNCLIQHLSNFRNINEILSENFFPNSIVKIVGIV